MGHIYNEKIILYIKGGYPLSESASILKKEVVPVIPSCLCSSFYNNIN